MAELRLATPADNEKLLRLFGQVPMEGQLVMSTQRDPDFFALYRLQGGEAECWVSDGPDGELTGMGSILVRDGWLDGRPTRVGYLGDLRAKFAAQRMRGLVRFYGDTFEAARVRHGCDVFLTAVLASNAAAIQALVKRKKRREGQPYYHLLRPFSLMNIPYLGRRRRRADPRLRVAHATEEEVAELTAFLAADHQRRPFGYRFDQGELQHRLSAWPDYSLRRTYGVRDPDGALLACATAWSPSRVKRYRVEAYRGAMAWQKRLINGYARLVGGTPLPAPGNALRTLYLTNLSLASERPEVLRALLEYIYEDTRADGYHVLSLPIYEGDGLAEAVAGFRAQAVDFHLYAVTSASAPRTEFPSARPGFEPALA